MYVFSIARRLAAILLFILWQEPNFDYVYEGDRVALTQKRLEHGMGLYYGCMYGELEGQRFES